MFNKTLRQLAWDYAQGKLDKEEYRHARAKLLEGILAGEVTLAENDYPSPLRPRSLHDPVEESTERHTHGRNGAARVYKRYPPGKRGFTAKAWPLVAGLLGLVVIGGLAYILLPPIPPESDDDSTDAAPVGDSAPEPKVDTTEARELITFFLQERSWKRESLESFLASWQKLPARQRQAMHESVELGRLANAIYKQLLAEEALSDLADDGAAREKQKMLVDFARRVGIDDPRFHMPEEKSQADTTPAGGLE